jgi:hypothetical protein
VEDDEIGVIEWVRQLRYRLPLPQMKTATIMASGTAFRQVHQGDVRQSRLVVHMLRNSDRNTLEGAILEFGYVQNVHVTKPRNH